jgi:DNA-binding phage protein
VNLLRSSNLRDKNEAAEFITNSDIRDEKVFEVVNKELLLGVREFSADDQHARTMHWLCMALSASGNPRFRATLETVSAEARDKGLRSAAKENADILR